MCVCLACKGDADVFTSRQQNGEKFEKKSENIFSTEMKIFCPKRVTCITKNSQGQE